eukprot:3115485-Pleurochrysis_carterae.AAC.2
MRLHALALSRTCAYTHSRLHAHALARACGFTHTRLRALALARTRAFTHSRFHAHALARTCACPRRAPHKYTPHEATINVAVKHLELPRGRTCNLCRHTTPRADANGCEARNKERVAASRASMAAAAAAGARREGRGLLLRGGRAHAAVALACGLNLRRRCIVLALRPTASERTAAARAVGHAISTRLRCTTHCLTTSRTVKVLPVPGPPASE